jgi:hypothetical protein
MRKHTSPDAQALEPRGEGVKTEYQAQERKSVVTRMSDDRFVNKKRQLVN